MLSYIGLNRIELDINGEIRSVIVNSSDTLLEVIRNKLGLTGAKAGCENGDCGTCTLMIDSLPVKSCLMLAVEAIGKKIITVEGLKDTPIQRAFIEQFAFQCGYCTSGFLIVCQSLAIHHPNASEDLIDEWLQSNICRCTGYEEIKKAIASILT